MSVRGLRCNQAEDQLSVLPQTDNNYATSFRASRPTFSRWTDLYRPHQGVQLPVWRQSRSKWRFIQILRCLIELPVLWTHIKNALTNPRFFQYLLRNFGRYRVMFLLVLYILSPFDILPESLLGIVGLLDDIFICLIVLAILSQAVMAFVRSQAWQISVFNQIFYVLRCSRHQSTRGSCAEVHCTSDEASSAIYVFY